MKAHVRTQHDSEKKMPSRMTQDWYKAKLNAAAPRNNHSDNNNPVSQGPNSQQGPMNTPGGTNNVGTQSVTGGDMTSSVSEDTERPPQIELGDETGQQRSSFNDDPIWDLTEDKEPTSTPDGTNNVGTQSATGGDMTSSVSENTERPPQTEFSDEIGQQ